MFVDGSAADRAADRPPHHPGAPVLLGLTIEQLREVVSAVGQPAYRAAQIYEWLYRHRVDSVDQMTNVPRDVRARLAQEWSVGATTPTRSSRSGDGTVKHLFPTLHGGFVEAAYIPEGTRATLCLSTQVGCRRSCTFCQTARQGFQGNLTVGEILNQYRSLPERESVTNIVYMGMGEPLDNPDAVLASLRILTDPVAFAVAARRITLSTVGVHPALERFLDESEVNLAVSLHNPFPAERRLIMPVENANPIEQTVELIRSRREDRRRKVSFEYTMFAGVNDTPRHVDGIAKLLNGLAVRVNLIRYHKIPATRLEPTPDDRIAAFEAALRDKGIRTFIRKSRGEDIQAACGMLWTRNAGASPAVNDTPGTGVPHSPNSN